MSKYFFTIILTVCLFLVIGCKKDEPTAPSITPPAAPAATAATNITSVSFTANWATVSGATKYYLDVATDAGFTSFVSGYNNLDMGNLTSRQVTGLNPNTAYYYRVRSYNGVQSSNSNTIAVTAASAAPAATAATNITSVSFTANWATVSGATKYYLDIATDAGFTSFVSGYNNLDIDNVTSLQVTGLNPNTAYYYRVRSYNGVQSSNSNTIAVTAASAAPAATAATNITSVSFTANWATVSGATKYYLDVATDAGFTSFVSGYNNLDMGNLTSRQVTGLNPNTAYYYRVRSYNGVQSSNSNTIAVTAASAAPAATAATNITSVSFTANWATVSGATKYYLDVATDAGFTSFVSGYNNLDMGNLTSRQVTGLNPNTAYYYRVRSYNGVQSSNSNTIAVTAASAAPAATAATNITSVSFTANWATVSGATKYYLDVATDAGFTSFVSGYNNLDMGNLTSLQVTGLNPNTAYYYRVRSYNGVQSPNSNTIAVTAASAAPAATAATNITSVSFTANWATVSGATKYYLDIATDAGFTSFVSGYNNLDIDNVTSLQVTGLNPNTAYYYRVRSYNGVQSSNSNTIAVTAASAAPAATAATNITSVSFTTNWATVSGATKYYLDVATDAGFTSFVSGYNNLDMGNLTSRQVTGLNPNTAYYYRVRSYNGVQSSNSNTIAVTTASAPAAPAATAATNITSVSFTANWATVSGATKYYLDVATDAGFTSFVSGYNNLDMGDVTSWQVTGLNSNTAYYYRVRSYNGVQSPNSNTIAVTTASAAPAATAATNITSVSFTANWTTVNGATKYYLDIATDAGFTSFVSGYNNLDMGDVTSWQVTGLNPYTTYYYRVRSYNGVQSPNSNTIAVTIPIFSATGGTITYSGGKTIHTFTNSGTFSVTESGNVEVLVVAGGGGGGCYVGGGGGAGGVVYKASYFATGNISVIIGAGGSGSTDPSVTGSNGENSIFESIEAIGGGGGASRFTMASSGGSGGGGSPENLGNSYGNGTSGQGYAGGVGGTTWNYLAGGGGGAGGVGSGGTGSGGNGNGGPGLTFTISGSSVYYGGGGGGGVYGTEAPGAGGVGGGGTGSNPNSVVGNGTSNSGGGGGGGGLVTPGSMIGMPGGDGGTGVVIVSYSTQ